MLTVKVAELCSSECLLKTTTNFRKLLMLFCCKLFQTGANYCYGEGSRCLSRTTGCFWLVAKIKDSSGLIFEGGVLCVKN